MQKMTTPLPRVYFITDRHQIPGKKSFFDVMEELLNAGLKLVQLREKDLTTRELFLLAQQLRHLTQSYNCRLIINDRIDIALAVSADGVHLGQHSLPPRAARDILGANALIGVSTHSHLELQRAQDQGADFATYGPVYFTPSKAEYGPPVGIHSLQEAISSVNIPVFALGGIKSENIREVLSSGCYGVAAISALSNALSPSDTYFQFSAALEKT